MRRRDDDSCEMAAEDEELDRISDESGRYTTGTLAQHSDLLRDKTVSYFHWPRLWIGEYLQVSNMCISYL